MNVNVKDLQVTKNHILVIRTGGSEQLIDNKNMSFTRHVATLIKANLLDFVSIGRAARGSTNADLLMAVDDSGYDKYLPPNSKATELYLAICHPNTMHRVLGDVAIFYDNDVAE